MLLETRLRVNALSTRLVQVNSDSLIVAIRLVHRCQFKRIAANATSYFAWTRMEDVSIYALLSLIMNVARQSILNRISNLE
jgi:hypothetical protein